MANIEELRFNQDIKEDMNKIPLHLGSTKLLEASAVIRTYGSYKYPTDSWKEVDPIRYYDALLRHLIACKDDLKAVDPESGYPHMYHVACNLGFILELTQDNIRL